MTFRRGMEFCTKEQMLRRIVSVVFNYKLRFMDLLIIEIRHVYKTCAQRGIMIILFVIQAN